MNPDKYWKIYSWKFYNTYGYPKTMAAFITYIEIPRKIYTKFYKSYKTRWRAPTERIFIHAFKQVFFINLLKDSELTKIQRHDVIKASIGLLNQYKFHINPASFYLRRVLMRDRDYDNKFHYFKKMLVKGEIWESPYYQRCRKWLSDDFLTFLNKELHSRDRAIDIEYKGEIELDDL